jgi:transposase
MIVGIGAAVMAKAYSYDLRQKVMQAIELDGMKKSEASELFNISRNTINLWFQRKAATGDVQTKPRPKSSPKRKIRDWEAFRVFAKAHEDKTQAEMAQLWEGEISSRTISRALQRLGLTRKKRRTGIANGTKPNGTNSGNN